MRACMPEWLGRLRAWADRALVIVGLAPMPQRGKQEQTEWALALSPVHTYRSLLWLVCIVFCSKMFLALFASNLRNNQIKVRAVRWVPDRPANTACPDIHNQP